MYGAIRLLFRGIFCCRLTHTHRREACQSHDALFPSLQPAPTSAYPQHKMASRAIKYALVDRLVRPHVFAPGRRVLAFRVLWRVLGDEVEAAWRGIVGSRRRSDDIVRRAGLASGNVSFFVSAVTGVFTKGKGSIKHGERPGTIYPAISYWVVLDSEAASAEVELFHQLGEANPSARIKYIVTVRADKQGGASLQSLDAMAAPLFVTLKDHRDSFTQRKVLRSARHLGLDDTAIAKLVVVDAVNCGQPLYEACAGFWEQKLQLEFDMSPSDEDAGVSNSSPLSLEFAPPPASVSRSLDPDSSPPRSVYSF